METEKRDSIDAESMSRETSTNFSSSFLTRLAQLKDDDEDEEPVDNSQD